MKKQNNRGFTLLELLVVIGILVFVLVVIPAFAVISLRRERNEREMRIEQARQYQTTQTPAKFKIGQSVIINGLGVDGIVSFVEDGQYGIVYKLSTGEIKTVLIAENMLQFK